MPAHALLQTHGFAAASFAARVDELHRTNERRVREGDLDHLIFYLLQSTHFTTIPPIEPALSAKAFVDTDRVSDDVRRRTIALLRAVERPSSDPRLAYFRQLITAAFPQRAAREKQVLGEYARAMAFLYQKEFVAPRAQQSADAVAELYRTRGLSTDTAVEAGYLVYQGLGVLQSLEPDRRIRRVLIVGPGLDLAPRTGFREAAPPESYQPWAVMDALFSLRLSKPDDLVVVAGDINPRVIEHLRRSQIAPPTLTLVNEIQDTDSVTLSDDYRTYFRQLGSSIRADKEEQSGDATKRLQKKIRVRADVAKTLQPVRLDIVTERLEGTSFDLVIATNILPYFADAELTLAITNVAAMLAPGGVLLHNEPRPSLGDITNAVGLPFQQSRQAVIATVRGAPGPLVDTVFLHRKR